MSSAVGGIYDGIVSRPGWAHTEAVEKGNILLLSHYVHGGTGRAAVTSWASTRPCAAATGTSVAGRGVSAARTSSTSEVAQACLASHLLSPAQISTSL